MKASVPSNINQQNELLLSIFQGGLREMGGLPGGQDPTLVCVTAQSCPEDPNHP